MRFRMGPAAIFDKSYLQSLTVDEAVWFDLYFTAATSHSCSIVTPFSNARFPMNGCDWVVARRQLLISFHRGEAHNHLRQAGSRCAWHAAFD